MYNSYRINPSKLRKMAALHTLYKLAAINRQQLQEAAAQARAAGQEETATFFENALNDVNKNVAGHKQAPKKPSVKMNPIEMENANLVAGKPLTAGPFVAEEPYYTRFQKFMRGAKAKGNAVGKHILKNKGAYGGGAAGVLGTGAAIYEGVQAHKNKKELRKAIAKLQTTDRGLRNANKRIRELENQGFFEFLRRYFSRRK